MSNLVFNEPTKLFATALDRVSTACFTGPAGVGWCCLAYFIAGGMIHMLARRVLRGLRG
jgi:hypothetical protein